MKRAYLFAPLLFSVYIRLMHGAGEVIWSMRTDPGRVRDHNEDFIAHYQPTETEGQPRDAWLFIVADGVGGSEAGEVASKLASERTIHHFIQSRGESSCEERLINAMRAANQDLQDVIIKRATGKRMATTMVASVIHGGDLTIANVGDSRAYLLKDGVLEQVTKDQSLVAKLVEEGVITEEEAKKHPRKNVILHSLGSEISPQIDTYQFHALPGDKLFLCSDGLIRHVADNEIESIVDSNAPEEATAELIQLANDRGGEDNISVAVMEIGAAMSPDDPLGSIEMSSASAAAGSNGQIAGGDYWLQTTTFGIIFVLLVLIIWILTGR